MSDPLAGTDPGRDSEPSLDAGFDNYRSLANPNIRIIVPKDVVPPFRFKAGGWELLSSTTKPGSAIQARIARKRASFCFMLMRTGLVGTNRSIFRRPLQRINGTKAKPHCRFRAYTIAFDLRLRLDAQLVGDQQNENSGDRGARRRVGRLCV